MRRDIRVSRCQCAGLHIRCIKSEGGIAKRNQKNRYMKRIVGAVGEDFELDGHFSAGLPRFIHKASGIPFQFVPGGDFLMGFSEEEEHSAQALSPVLQLNVDEMRPIQRRVVGPMLVSVSPILNRQCFDEPGDFDSYPAYLKRDAALELAEKFGCRLPKESEWEYLYRAGTRTLFPFGNSLPSDDELEGWLSSNFESLARLRCNGFGLYGMTNPEWCQEQFTVSLADDATLLDGSYVIRGGGAYFWPWQDEEWVWCISAMRSPSSGLEAGEACLRLVRDVSLIDAES